MNAASQSWHHTPSIQMFLEMARDVEICMESCYESNCVIWKGQPVGNCYRQEMHIEFFLIFLPNLKHEKENFTQPYLNLQLPQPEPPHRNAGGRTTPGPGLRPRSAVVRGTGRPAHGGNARPRDRSLLGPAAPPVELLRCFFRSSLYSLGEASRVE